MTRSLTREEIAHRLQGPLRIPTRRLERPARPEHELRQAAVLIPLIERPAGMTVLLTLRTAHLSNHAGQVSFPGGRSEPADKDAVETALRETEEEIGLPRNHVEILGRMTDYITGSRFRVTPVIGVIRPPFPLETDPTEVESVFEAPLGLLMDPANQLTKTRLQDDGTMRHYYEMNWPDRRIWGITAGILVELSDILVD
jgi:8-oxo-dGTP pyrophosphatase MutT (NUDIX family)